MIKDEWVFKKVKKAQEDINSIGGWDRFNEYIEEETIYFKDYPDLEVRIKFKIRPKHRIEMKEKVEK